MAIVRNKHGRVVIVSEDELEDSLKRGSKIVYDTPIEFDWDNVASVLFHRNCGGLGDIVTLAPSVLKVAETKKVALAIPSQFHFLFKGTNTTLIDFAEYIGSSIAYQSGYDTTINLFCPAGIHEYFSNYRPTRNRIENFADYLKLTPTAPKLKIKTKSPIKTKKFKIAFQLKSANPVKDWPVENYIALAKLIGSEAFLASIDMTDEITFVDENFVGKSTKQAAEYLSNFDLVVGADSGLLHVAAAMGKYTLWLFGPTDGPLTLKYYKHSFYIQGGNIGQCHAPCYYAGENKFNCIPYKAACMASIKPDFVYEKIKYIRGLIEKKRGPK